MCASCERPIAEHEAHVRHAAGPLHWWCAVEISRALAVLGMA